MIQITQHRYLTQQGFNAKSVKKASFKLKSFINYNDIFMLFILILYQPTITIISIQMGTINCCEPSQPQKQSTPVPIHQPTISISLPKIKQPHDNQSERRLTQSQPIVLPSRSQKVIVNPKQRSPQNYQYLKFLGKGSFGFVVQVQQKDTKKKYAMKIIQKTKIVQFNVLQSQLVRTIGNHNYLVSIHETFQNDANVYIVMQHLPMGDIYFYIRKKEINLSQVVIKGILAEIVIGLEYLHTNGVVYRQLKPQNIMVTMDGHIKLTDYGLSKPLLDPKKFISTFVGTPQYMAPQVIDGKFDQRSDIWSLGIIMFELLFKQNPYDGGSDRKLQEDMLKDTIQQNFLQQKINSKIGYMSLTFRDLLLKMLQKNPNKRISLEQIRGHQFFKEVDWQKVKQQQHEPPLKQLVQKHDFIKFRDPAAEEYSRRRITRHQKNQGFELNLYEFRASE